MLCRLHVWQATCLAGQAQLLGLLCWLLSKCSVVTCRESGAGRAVTHYHYHAWPDRGIPRTTLPLRRLARLLDSTDDPQAGPPVVHCSAGIGRTGVFLVSPCP